MNCNYKEILIHDLQSLIAQSFNVQLFMNSEQIGIFLEQTLHHISWSILSAIELNLESSHWIQIEDTHQVRSIRHFPHRSDKRQFILCIFCVNNLTIDQKLRKCKSTAFEKIVGNRHRWCQQEEKKQWTILSTMRSTFFPEKMIISPGVGSSIIGYKLKATSVEFEK